MKCIRTEFILLLEILKMSKEHCIKTLLKNFVETQEHLEIAYLYSSEGLLISKYGKVELDESKNSDEVEEVYGAFSALVEKLLDRIASEYEIGGYGTGTFETAENRIIYVETGREGILLLICHYEIDLKRILPLAYLVAEKITQILEDTFDPEYHSLEVPDLNLNGHLSLNLNQYTIEESKPIIDGVKMTHYIKEEKTTVSLFKLILLGSSAVGKTTLINQFLKRDVPINYRPTLGIAISEKEFYLRGNKDKKIQFLIYDLAGQEFFKRVRHEYYKGANCAFIMYDITREDTFKEALDFWVPDIKKELGDIPFVLIGNKVDLENERVIPKELGAEMAEKNGGFFIETSALKNINVQETFKIAGIGLFFQSS